jgi:hypothetical protein
MFLGQPPQMPANTRQRLDVRHQAQSSSNLSVVLLLDPLIGNYGTVIHAPGLHGTEAAILPAGDFDNL